ncbi:MAG: alpha/beta fold hydrolase [Pseudomonadota bacterium]
MAVLVFALAAICASVIGLQTPYQKIETVTERLGQTPVTRQWRHGSEKAPTVVIAHGFAGSRQLMQPFAVTLAMNGYRTISFDFLGHGRNSAPLAGDITRETGATQALLGETQKVVAYARSLPGGDGRIALLGHSMASDILVRAANQDPGISATVAVSMFSEQVTATSPKNLLMIVGEYEGFLTRAALANLQSIGIEAPEVGETYLAPNSDNRRRVSVSNSTEHVSVLYSKQSLREAVDWLDLVFHRQSDGWVERRAPWLGLLFAGVIALGWPLAALLSPIKRDVVAFSSSRFVLLTGAAALITPLILWPMPTALLPVLVADYLALHFLVYGAIVAVGLRWFAAVSVSWPSKGAVIQTIVTTIFVTSAIALPLDLYVASFVPVTTDRLVLIALLGVGTVCYCLSDAWLICCNGRRWWWPWASKAAFLGSIALAISLNLSELFFLIIILPVIVLFFAVYGLFGLWLMRSTKHPSVGGMAIGVAFAWALGVTFPLLAS